MKDDYKEADHQKHATEELLEKKENVCIYKNILACDKFDKNNGFG